MNELDLIMCRAGQFDWQFSADYSLQICAFIAKSLVAKFFVIIP